MLSGIGDSDARPCGMQVFAWQICCEPANDSHRFMDAIDAAIEAGHVSRYTAYSRWSTATAKQPRPRSPLARKKKRKQKTDESALVAQIRRAPHPSSHAGTPPCLACSSSMKRSRLFTLMYPV